MITCEALGHFVLDVLDADEAHLPPEAVIQDVSGWDSVNALRLLIHLEAMFAVKLSPELLEESLTIQALHEVIVSS